MGLFDQKRNIRFNTRLCGLIQFLQATGISFFPGHLGVMAYPANQHGDRGSIERHAISGNEDWAAENSFPFGI